MEGGHSPEEEFRCFQKFFEDRKDHYDDRLMETARDLADMGLKCDQLLNTNFNTNQAFNAKRANRDDKKILRAYARDVQQVLQERTEGYVDDLVVGTMLGLLHEMYYTILSDVGKKAKKPPYNLGVDKKFAENIALEVIAKKELRCPWCNFALQGEHLQYRGD